MKSIFGKKFVMFLVFLTFVLNGCMRFTQRDYDLQEKAYQKERQQQEERDRDRLQLRW